MSVLCPVLQINFIQENFIIDAGLACPLEFFNEVPPPQFQQEDQSNLEKLFQSEGFFEIVECTVSKSPADILLMILKYCVSNTISFSGTRQSLTLMNNFLGKDILPDSPHFINKYFNPKNNVEYHGLCKNAECSGYLGKIVDFNKLVKCPACAQEQKLSKMSYKNFFVIMDPTESIKNIMNRYGDSYDDIIANKNHKPGTIQDIMDGDRYKRFVNTLPEEERRNYISCLMNTDGANPYESTTKALWPIYLLINEIPITARFRNIVTCGIWFGKHKPNMMMYLTAFVDLFNEKLSKIGVDCCIKGMPRNLKIHCINCTVDSICRAPVEGIRQFNGRCGCSWCTIPGVILDTNRYSLLLCDNYENRDHKSMVEHMRAIHQGKTFPVDDGVIGVSALINLPYYNIVESFGNDYLHAALLGVAAQVTELILRTLSLRQTEEIDEYLTKIKIPYQLCRTTRSIAERKQWKGKEWEEWVLFHSLPIFNKVADPSLVKYWSLFVQGMHILLSTEIPIAELVKANEMLFKFGFLTETFFGVFEMTSVIHAVAEHLAQQVFNWGPLFVDSCYPFESENRNLLRAINSPVGVNQQLIRYINLSHTVLELEKKVLSNASEIFAKYYEQISTRKLKKGYRLAGNIYFGATALSIEELGLINHFLLLCGKPVGDISNSIWCITDC